MGTEHGLELSQREEWRKKHRIRLFIEEQIVGMLDITVLILQGLVFLIDLSYRYVIALIALLGRQKKFFAEDKSRVIIALLAIIILIALLF